MSKKDERRERLMPGGVPRYIRIYDNGGVANGGSIDRYTVVFTGRYRYHIEGYGLSWFLYLAMNGAPFDPQGFCQHGESPERIDWPQYSHLGKKIAFTDLPADCQNVVIQDYKAIWDLNEDCGD